MFCSSCQLSGEPQPLLTWAILAHPSAKALAAASLPCPGTLGTLSSILGDASCFGRAQPHLLPPHLRGSCCPAWAPSSSLPQLEDELLAKSHDSGHVDLLSVPAPRALSCTACYRCPDTWFCLVLYLLVAEVGLGPADSSCLLVAFPRRVFVGLAAGSSMYTTGQGGPPPERGPARLLC